MQERYNINISCCKKWNGLPMTSWQFNSPLYYRITNLHFNLISIPWSNQTEYRPEYNGILVHNINWQFKRQDNMVNSLNWQFKQQENVTFTYLPSNRAPAFQGPHNTVVAREVRGRQQSCLVVIRSLYSAILAFLLISGDIPLGHCSTAVIQRFLYHSLVDNSSREVVLIVSLTRKFLSK